MKGIFIFSLLYIYKYSSIINLFPQDIILHKGDKIGQGIFLNYNRVNHDYNPDYIKTSREGGFGSTS